MTANLVTQHFFAPANVGEIDKPDGSSIVASASCGAVLRLSLSVDEAQRITAAKFKLLVAVTSWLLALF